MRAHVLIVDDNVANLVALRTTLKSFAVQVHEALSGNEALSILLRQKIDLVFMDVRMPHMDGYETANCMRGMDEYKDIPIIFVTGNDSEDIPKTSLLAKTKHIFKPINKDEIAKVISETIFPGVNYV